MPNENKTADLSKYEMRAHHEFVLFGDNRIRFHWSDKLEGNFIGDFELPPEFFDKHRSDISRFESAAFDLCEAARQFVKRRRQAR